MTLPNSRLTSEALTLWSQIPPSTQSHILTQVWCSRCCRGVSLSLQSLKRQTNSLIIKGDCQTCGGLAVRVLELDSAPD